MTIIQQLPITISVMRAYVHTDHRHLFDIRHLTAVAVKQLLKKRAMIIDRPTHQHLMTFNAYKGLQCAIPTKRIGEEN